MVEPPSVGVGSVGSVVALSSCSQRPPTRFLLVESLEPGLCLGPVVAESDGVESLGVSEPVVAPSVGAGVCTAPAGG